MSLLGWILCSVAMLALVIAAVGILRLPDALARQHAATKAGTVAVSLFALGLALVAWDAGWGWPWLGRLLATVLILLTTLPLASHALARAAAHDLPGEQAHEPPPRT